MSSSSNSPRGKQQSRGKATKGKVPERIKCSLLLTRENDLRLTVLANVRGKDRSTILNEFLDDCLRGVVVSLRGQLATESGAGEGPPAAADGEMDAA